MGGWWLGGEVWGGCGWAPPSSLPHLKPTRMSIDSAPHRSAFAQFAPAAAPPQDEMFSAVTTSPPGPTTSTKAHEDEDEASKPVWSVVQSSSSSWWKP